MVLRIAASLEALIGLQNRWLVYFESMEAKFLQRDFFFSGCERRKRFLLVIKKPFADFVEVFVRTLLADGK